MITEKYFTERVGRPPEQDDLERVNCSQAGEIGHWSCGWCATHDLPVFMCGCHFKEVKRTTQPEDK